MRNLVRIAALLALAAALYAAGRLTYLWCCGPFATTGTAVAVPAGQPPAPVVQHTLTGRESGQGVLLVWATVLAAAGALGAGAAWRGRPLWTGVTAFGLLLLALLGMFSIGMIILPAAFAFLLTHLLGLAAGSAGRDSGGAGPIP